VKNAREVSYATLRRSLLQKSNQLKTFWHFIANNTDFQQEFYFLAGSLANSITMPRN
jgi:hypothetical protein